MADRRKLSVISGAAVKAIAISIDSITSASLLISVSRVAGKADIPELSGNKRAS